MRTVACFMFTYHKQGSASANTWHWDIAGNKFNVSRAVDKVSERARRTVLETNLLLCLYGSTITIHTSVICFIEGRRLCGSVVNNNYPRVGYVCTAVSRPRYVNCIYKTGPLQLSFLELNNLLTAPFNYLNLQHEYPQPGQSARTLKLHILTRFEIITTTSSRSHRLTILPFHHLTIPPFHHFNEASRET